MGIVQINSTKKTLNTKLFSNLLKDAKGNLSSILDTVDAQKQVGIKHFYYSDQKSFGIPSADIATLKSFESGVGINSTSFYYKITDDFINAVNSGKSADFSSINSNIQDLNPEYVGVDQECYGTDRSRGQVPDNSYVKIAQQLVNHYPNIIWGIDIPLVSKSNQGSRSVACFGITGTNIVGRCYIQISPDIYHFSNDALSNLGMLDAYYTNDLPNSFFSKSPEPNSKAVPNKPIQPNQTATGYAHGLVPRYPNIKRFMIIQDHDEDNTGNGYMIQNNAVGNYSWGRRTEFYLTNTDIIYGVAVMSNARLFNSDGTISPLGTTIKRTATLYNDYKYVQQLTISLNGVSGLLFSNDDGTKAILLNNRNSTPQTIQGTEFGTNLTFTRDTGYGITPDQITNETIAETNITVRPYSSSVITFKQNASS